MIKLENAGMKEGKILIELKLNAFKKQHASDQGFGVHFRT